VNRRAFISLLLDAIAGRVDALYVGADPLSFTYRLRINTLALGARLPTAHNFRELSRRRA
jgi:putative ABC transport system substrate-binding protein